MNKLKYTAFGLAIAVAAVVSCKKEADPTVTLASTDGSAYVRFVHVAPNFRSIMGVRDSFHIYNRINKLNSAFLTYNAGFPALIASTTAQNIPTYVSVPVGDADKQTSGLTPFRFTLPGGGTPDSITVHSFSRMLTAGRYYSLIITDSIKSNNPNKQMFIEDDFTSPEMGRYSVRFIHAVHNDTAAGRTVDLFSVKNKANIFTNVAAGSATGFLNFPTFTTAGNDTLILRRSGTLYEIARINNIIQSNTRVYSILYKGNALTTGTKARSLTFYVNR